MKAGFLFTRAWVVALACGAFAASAAKADLCDPRSNQPASCHIVQPIEEITWADGIVPALSSALFWNEDSVRIEAPAVENGVNVSEPGLDLRLGAGGFGSGSAEPMVIARSTVQYLVGGRDVEWVFPLRNAKQWGEGCEVGTSLCYNDDRLGITYIWPRAVAEMWRMLRITQTNPATLPASVTHVPLRIDYTMAIYSYGTHSPIPSGGAYTPVGGTATVMLGSYNQQYRYEQVHCVSTVKDNDDAIQCRNTLGDLIDGVEGNVHSGTFTYHAPVAHLDKVQMRIIAVSSFLTNPWCFDRETTYGTQCVVDPVIGSGHSLADPFVYIDPSWEYASWFELEIATDETDTEWATPERRGPFDTENLRPITSDPEGDAGVSGDGDGDGDGDGNGDGDGDGDGGGDGDSDADADSDGSSGGDSGCGCRVGPGASTPSAAWSLLGFASCFFAWRRRRPR